LATVGVIGLGYVGLPLARLMQRADHHVIGFDTDPEKIAMLRAGTCYLRHLQGRYGDDFINEMNASGRFEAEASNERYPECDALIMCVPTPLDREHKPDLSYVRHTALGIAERMVGRKQRQLIVLESTSYPGTTRDLLRPILERSGAPFDLAFSPEREDPGGPWDTVDIPKLVGGIDPQSRDRAVELYASAFRTVVPVGGENGGAEVAESAKLLENIYRAVNIALVNEMKIVLDAMDIDIWEVLDAAATKPFGFSRFTPGPGLGGHCIPIDPYYLSYVAEQHGVHARMIELAGRINTAMPARVMARTMEAIGRPDDEQGRSVLILGLAYKPNIDDVRESPTFELIHLFLKAGCAVAYSDPHVPRTHRMRRWGDLNMESSPLSPESVAAYDAVVVSTAHDAFDWAMIARHARVIVDTRNALQGYDVAGRLIKA
jgi:UDP-N-acetyl-D-glucosamine dehydrogenase